MRARTPPVAVHQPEELHLPLAAQIASFSVSGESVDWTGPSGDWACGA